MVPEEKTLWSFFDIRAECKMCHENVTLEQERSFLQLWTHLDTAHQIVLKNGEEFTEDEDKENISPLEEAEEQENVSQLEDHHFDFEEVDNQCDNGLDIELKPETETDLVVIAIRKGEEEEEEEAVTNSSEIIVQEEEVVDKQKPYPFSHFEKDPYDSKKSICKICSASIHNKFRQNLSHHLNRSHNIMKSTIDDTQYPYIHYENDPDNPNPELSICKICAASIRHTRHNLSRHLNRKHNIINEANREKIMKNNIAIQYADKQYPYIHYENAPDDPQKLICKICSAFIKHTRHRLSIHLNRKHNIINEIKKKTLKSEKPVIGPGQDGRKKRVSKVWKFFVQVDSSVDFQCSICNKITPRENRSQQDYMKRLRYHLRNKHGLFKEDSSSHICPDCGKEYDKAGSLWEHLQTHRKSFPHYCPFGCGKGFQNKNQRYEYHLRTHTGEKPFMCNECGKCFRAQNILNLHHKNVHLKARPFLCTECPKAFSKKDHLENHLRKHTGEKPFGCQECGKSFKTAGVLKTHERIHSGETPYECTKCLQKFMWRAALKTHKCL